MARDSAEIRGRARVRPFRVAQLVDLDAPGSLRTAIKNLTYAWGGLYTPIFDASLTFEDIELQARLFDVDALHIDTEEQGDLREQLRRSDWLWRGHGRWGPFAPPEEGFRTGVLPVSAIALDPPSLYLPEWDSTDSLDPFFTAAFGVQVAQDAADQLPMGSQRVGLGALFALPGLTVDQVGLIQATRVGLSPEAHVDVEWLNGVFVVRPDQASDLVSFWNLRSFGQPVVPVPADASEELLAFLTRGSVPGGTSRYGGPNPRTEKYLGVWGLDHASDRTKSAIDRMAASQGMVVRDHHGLDRRTMFPGLDSRFKASVRAEFQSSSNSVMVRVPTVPLVPGTHEVMPGTVAVEIDVNDVSGLDPRFTPSLPPFRRFGSLLERSGMSHSNQVRVTPSGGGVIVCASATNDEVPVGFAYHLDAISTLFDNREIKVAQSDDGRFQTRASEMLGGPAGGLLVQPGVRAVLQMAGRTPAGLTLQQLRAAVKNARGAWPDTLAAFRTSPDDYAERTVNNLLYSGLFIPMLDVHCSHCRVNSQVSPRDLDSSVQCEFCGESFRLALSLALSKSRWRYRLASHLGSEKIKALLPALATSSLLAQLTTPFGPPGLHGFGVDFKLPGNRRMEADIVAYLGRPDWAVALAEVKSGNWIDQEDVENLESLQGHLDEAKMRSILTFATLKDQLDDQEINLLRELVGRGRMTTTAFGMRVPRVPLVLTSNELSRPWDDDDHPSRWRAPGSGDGIFTTAYESCKRNLGLVDLHVARTEDGAPFSCTWQDVVATTVARESSE